jgi:hypothetical protein
LRSTSLLVFIPSIAVGFSASAAAMAVREPAAFDAVRTLITRGRDLWREPSGRLAHDRLADTVVLGSAPAERDPAPADAPMTDE